MSKQGFSTKHIEYLEKDFLDEMGGKITLSNVKTLSLGEPKLLKIRSLSSFWEMRDEKIVSLRLFMEDLISGLHEAGMPLVFAIFGTLRGVDIVIGTTSGASQNPDDGLKVIRTSLQGSFQGIELEEQPQGYLSSRLDGFDYIGLVTGVPTEKVGTEKVGVEQIERLIRGLYGRDYGYLVVATPVKGAEINNLFNSVLNELRIVTDSEKSGGLETPLSKRYKDLLGAYLGKLQLAKNQGLWHSQVILLSRDAETLSHLKAVAKSVFGGRESMPEPVRTFNVVGKVKNLILITSPAPLSPGQFFYPYSLMSTLNTSDLANFVNLPTQEMPGFQIKSYSRFNVSKQGGGQDSLKIGEILDQGLGTGNFYSVPVKSLRKHGLIVGTTGSGKTNTLFYMLKEAWRNKIPFLVVEPAKTEYRGLLFSEELGKDIKVYTLGDNNVSPFRMNPFEIMPGVSAQTHIDLLKSVFNASFFMWGPLPHVLERCIYEVYTDRGWDLTTNENHRGRHRNASPTLTDLYNKVDVVVDELGYSAETTMEIKSALKTRINSMRIGGKGLMLDTKNSTPFSTLISKPTILELEAIGDDEEKSFIIGLIFTRMYEHYVSKGLSEVSNLTHITVIEEAHRLLGNYGQENPYVGNTRGKAVETFSNILSEVRAYGEGFLIAEQIPTKLNPDVIKNTNLKVMHRLVAEDDRRVIGATMNVDERESEKVTSLNVGEAAVFSEGDDGPYHVKVPYSKIEAKKGEREKEEEAIRKIMAGLSDATDLAPYNGCTGYCKAVCRYKEQGGEVSSSHRYFSQMPILTLALLDDSNSAESTLLQMMEMGVDEGNRAKDQRGVKICAEIQATERYFEELGSGYSWPYEDVEKVKAAFLELITDATEKYMASPAEFTPASINESKIQSFRDAYREVCAGKQPTQYCGDICGEEPCLYRFNLKEALSDDYYGGRFIEIIEEGGDDMWSNLFGMCLEAVQGAILPDGSEDAARRIALCYALHKCNSIKSFNKRHIDTVMGSLIEYSRDEAKSVNGGG